MEKLLLLYIFAFYLNVVVSTRFKGESTIFLGELLKNQNKPVKMTLFVCWTNDEKVQLIKFLNKMDIETDVENSIKVPRKFFEEHRMFLIDFSCPFFQEILTEANKTGLFRQPYRWIAFVDNLDEIPPYLNLFVDSKFYAIVKESNIIILYMIFRIEGKNENYTAKELAIWSSNQSEINFINSSNKIDMNLRGALITISLVVTNEDTINNLWTYRNTHIDAITKLNYILVYHLMDMVNATRKYVIRNTWGYKNSTTGLYSGMVGDLQTGLAQLGGTAAFFTEERVSIIEYFASTTRTHMKFIFRAPPLSYVQNIYILPFAVSVWYALLLLLCVVPIVVYVAVRWERRDATNKDGFLDAVMLEISAVCQQGSPTEMKHVSGRIAVIFTFVALMFLYTSYAANIVALLQSATDRMNTLEDLLGSRIKLGVEDIVYAHYYFSDSADPIRKAIIKQKIAPQGQQPNFFDVQTGIQKMRDEFFGFHIELSNGYKMVESMFQEHEKCGLTEVEYIRLVEPYLATKKDYSARELLKIGMRQMHESGIQNREANLIYSKKPKCLARGSNFVSVGLIDCYFPFILYASSIGICVTLLIFESLLHYFLKRNKLRVNNVIDKSRFNNEYN